MTQQSPLSQEYVGYEVSSNTLYDFDLLENSHEFLKQHYKGYCLTETAYLAQTYINRHKIKWPFTDKDKDDIAYLVNEALYGMIDEIAPIGTYFSAHEGNGSLMGFWPIVDFELALQDFDHIFDSDLVLPYRHTGYNLFSADCHEADKIISAIDDFLSDNFSTEYEHSDLECAMSDLYITPHGLMAQNMRVLMWANKLIAWLTSKLLPSVVDSELEYRLSDDQKSYGFYPKQKS